MKYGNRGALQQQYNYYLLEAARTAKDKDRRHFTEKFLKAVLK